jgi:hypothetical protein
MKKTIITLMLLMLTFGTSNAAQPVKENPRQAGKSSIYFYDVECKSPVSNGYGRLVINAAKKTFTFIGQDFIPNQQVHIKVDTASKVEIIAQGKSTKTGNLHIQGEWEGTVLPEEGTVGAYYYYEPAYAFQVENMGGYVAHIKVMWSTDKGVTWHTSNAQSKDISFLELFTQEIYKLDPGGVIKPGDLVRMKLVVVGGDDTFADEWYTYVTPPFCYPLWRAHGPTWNAYVELYNNACTPYLGSNYWCEYDEYCYW